MHGGREREEHKSVGVGTCMERENEKNIGAHRVQLEKLLPHRTVQALLGWISKPTAQKRHAEAFRRWIAFLQHKRQLVIAAPHISRHRGFFRNFICLSHFFRDFVQKKRGDQISYQIILHITLSMPWCFEPFFQIMGFGYKARGLLGMCHQKFVFQKYLKDIGLNSRFKMDP